MSYYLKIFIRKFPNQNYTSAGFTLIELLMAISIMGITASLISYGISSMITSNQNLSTEQNRRVEASRALDLIANDVRISEIKSGRTSPSGSGVGGNLVLDMDIASGTCLDRIIYSIQASSSGEIGPNVVYRYGRIPDGNGTINCGDVPRNVAIADGISINNIEPPTCNATSLPASPATGINGFYSCVSDNQASIAIFSKLSITKTYGINRLVTSGFIPDIPTITDDCTVPDLSVGAPTPKTKAEAETAISTTTNLLFNGINIEQSTAAVAGRPVLSQMPQPGTAIPCAKGLVTYTY